jgi:hypothetical protein
MRSTVMPKDCRTVIAVLQQNKVGPVIGITKA